MKHFLSSSQSRRHVQCHAIIKPNLCFAQIVNDCIGSHWQKAIYLQGYDYYHRLFLSHICYRCLLQMFSSCWVAIACSLNSLRSSLCCSQWHEVLHTPRSFQIFTQRCSSQQRLVGSNLWQPTDQTTPPSPLWIKPVISGFAQTRAHTQAEECCRG